MPTLESLATAVPEHRLGQDEVIEIARAFLEERAPELLPYLSAFENAGVEQRFISRELPWYLGNPGWRERAEAFAATGVDLAEEVTRAALERADVPVSSVDAVVFVTTTGIATPSLEARLANRIGLREDVVRLPVWGLGCGGGVAGLARAGDLARADPERRVLLVSLELCSLAFLSADLSKKNVVAAALFGDGCAAALVSGDALEAEGPRIGSTGSHLYPETERVMGWDVLDEGLSVVFSKEIPRLVREEFAGPYHRFVKGAGLDPAQVRTPFHPGGSKVIDGFEEALGRPPEAFADSRRVLAERGNLSSPTVLFVLERALARAPLGPDEPAVLSALGPGFAAEFAVLHG